MHYKYNYKYTLCLSLKLAYLSNSSLSEACINATMVLVTDVPMLEPITMGMAEQTSSTAWTDRHTDI